MSRRHVTSENDVIWAKGLLKWPTREVHEHSGVFVKIQGGWPNDYDSQSWLLRQFILRKMPWQLMCAKRPPFKFAMSKLAFWQLSFGQWGSKVKLSFTKFGNFNS